MATRKQKRIAQKIKDHVFDAMVEGFFKDIVGKKPNEIIDLYKRYEKVWIAHCNKLNNSTKEVHLYKDAFEGAIKIRGHISIKNSDKNAKTKLYALHLLHPIQGHSKIYYFFRDLGIWFDYLSEYKKKKIK